MSPADAVAIGTIALFLGIGVFGCLDDYLYRRAQRKPVDAVQDYVNWKRQRRLEDQADWQRRFNVLLPASPRPARILPPPPEVYWDGRHYTTCPYECDCPVEARLRNNG